MTAPLLPPLPAKIKLSVVIPVYNEVNHVDEVVAHVSRINLPSQIEREIIIVDDGSTDGTSVALEKHHGQGEVCVHSHERNYGKGTAVRTGIERATGDILLIQDCDLEYDVNDYPALLAPFLNDSAAVVYGSRFRGSIKNMRFRFRLANMLLRWMTNILYGSSITDEATAYKLFRMDVVRSLQLKSVGFEICPEMTAKVLKCGHRIHEVAINYKARTRLEGKKITWVDAFGAFWTLFKYRFLKIAKMNDINQHFDINLNEIVPEYHSGLKVVREIFLKRQRIALSYLTQSGGKRVLDAGCGDGSFAIDAAKVDGVEEVLGVDLNVHVEGLNRNFGKVKFERADLLELGFEAKFDFVVMLDVLEHFPNAQKALDSALKVMVKGGYLVVSGPTENFMYRLGRFFTKGSFSQETGPGAGAHYHNIISLDEIIRQSLVFVEKKVVRFFLVPLFHVNLYRKR